MEDELYDLLDETMEINHQITEYMIEITRADIKGVKIKGKRNIGLKDVEENVAIKKLFARLQEKYRQIQEIILQPQETDNNVLNGYVIIDEKDRDLTMGNVETRIGILKDYLEEAYTEMRYINVLNPIDGSERKSIFDDRNFQGIHNAEYRVQLENLDNIAIRLGFNEEKSTLNFIEKARVLDSIGKTTYYGNFSMKQIESYIKKAKKANKTMEAEVYEEIIRLLYEQKYILVYEYMHNKYNGILQENDIGKTGLIKKLIDDDEIGFILKIPDFEIETNISQRIVEFTERLNKSISEILEIKEREELTSEKDGEHIVEEFSEEEK